jgi:hypothetical protein
MHRIFKDTVCAWNNPANLFGSFGLAMRHGIEKKRNVTGSEQLVEDICIVDWTLRLNEIVKDESLTVGMNIGINCRAYSGAMLDPLVYAVDTSGFWSGSSPYIFCL